MARLPYVEPATAPEHVRELLEQLPVKLNVFRMMAHAESDFRPLVGLGTAILGRQKLSAKLRELAILRVAALSPARYEWVQHVPIAQAMGATPAQVAALERGDIAADAFDSLERVVLRFTTEVVRDVRASEATFAELARLLSAQEIVELIITVGYYMMIARWTRSGERGRGPVLQLDQQLAEAPPAPVDGALGAAARHEEDLAGLHREARRLAVRPVRVDARALEDVEEVVERMAVEVRRLAGLEPHLPDLHALVLEQEPRGDVAELGHGCAPFAGVASAPRRRR